MRRGRGLAIGVSCAALAAACGTRTALLGEEREAPPANADAGARAPMDAGAGPKPIDLDAAAPRPIDAAPRDAGAVPVPFACGDHTCKDDTQEYCLSIRPGCIPLGGACTTNADCCTLLCAGGVCGGPDAGDAGDGLSHTCTALPVDCRTSPATCACVTAHQPCGSPGSWGLSCTDDAGAVYVTCGGE